MLSSSGPSDWGSAVQFFARYLKVDALVAAWGIRRRRRPLVHHVRDLQDRYARTGSAAPGPETEVQIPVVGVVAPSAVGVLEVCKVGRGDTIRDLPPLAPPCGQQL